VRFTREHFGAHNAARRQIAVNHVARAFIQNKRYRTKAHGVSDVVNRNARSIYQTDAVFIAY
jgi:hypothetical protein